ncbi:DNA-binding MarR family transcriptional regulator [Rhodoligotrophos appendicifer]|uniref:MarR family winged helix-turn-helix transcriptional regulator n=1 Tax=Rhodoligotrophos appendicifer TaxID=987056 RepID=UPI001184D334|nr:MarR family transcriptional regulator [Rhodoligotrophos appendicifer]
MSMGEDIVTLDTSVYHLIKRAAQFATTLFGDHNGYSGLTHRQFTVLLAVAQNEGASQTQLVRATGIDRSTLADLVARLLKNGLLQRKRTREDGRTNTIKLSAAGRRALQSAQPGAMAVEQKMLNVVPKNVQRDLLEGLRALSEAYGLQMEAHANGFTRPPEPRPRGRRPRATLSS